MRSSVRLLGKVERCFPITKRQTDRSRLILLLLVQLGCLEQAERRARVDEIAEAGVRRA